MIIEHQKWTPEAAKPTYDFYHGIMTREDFPSERSLSDDWDLSRLMIRKPEIQALLRAQAEQKMYDFRMLKEALQGAR